MCYADLSYSRPDLSIFALLGLGLGLGLLKTVNQVHFQFPLCTSALFCLGCMTFCQLVSYTQPKISVTYLIVTAELAQGLACSFAIYLSGDNVSSDPESWRLVFFLEEERSWYQLHVLRILPIPSSSAPV